MRRSHLVVFAIFSHLFGLDWLPVALEQQRTTSQRERITRAQLYLLQEFFPFCCSSNFAFFYLRTVVDCFPSSVFHNAILRHAVQLEKNREDICLTSIA